MTREMEYYYAVREGDLGKLSALAAEEADFCVRIKPYDQSLLLQAAFSGQLAVAEFLLRHGCAIDAADGQGYTALHGAVEYDHTDMARLLLDHGANIDPGDRGGQTPLARAVFLSKGKMEMIKLLIDRGADPEKPNIAGITPLAFAEKIGLKEAAAYMRRHKKEHS
jgi:uncharacterized protein